jgi:hypothetical protein
MLSLRVMQSRMQWTRNGKKPRIPTTKQTVPHLVFVCGCLAFRNNKANFVSGITNHIFSIRLAMELARLERNRERRFAREKAKGIAAPSPSEAGGAGSPTSPAGSAAIPSKQQQGTQRKCANCGQVGHIKTNKKCAPGFPSHNFILVTALLQGRGNAPPGLQCRQRGIRILQIHLPRTLMKIGCSTTDRRDAIAGGFVCISRCSTCTRGRSYSDHGPLPQSSTP